VPNRAPAAMVTRLPIDVIDDPSVASPSGMSANDVQMPELASTPELPPFWRDVRSSFFVWSTAMLFSGGVCIGLVELGYLDMLLHAASWLVIGFVILPVGSSVALAGCAAVLSVVLGLLALPAWLLGRATGLGDILADAWRLAGQLLPEYWLAVRRLREPGLWGAMLGLLLVILAHLLAAC
jgi:hypothetical protein